jgi:hypothetical protein
MPGVDVRFDTGSFVLSAATAVVPQSNGIVHAAFSIFMFDLPDQY